MTDIVFRIRQNGRTIDAIGGPNAEAEIMRYAAHRRRDGEVMIQHNAQGYWKRFALLCQWPLPAKDAAHDR